MATIHVASRPSGTKAVDTQAIDALRNDLASRLLAPGDPGYDQARKIWNAMIDRHPALIARCQSPAEVRHAVDFARRNELLLSIRGGGHNIAGNAVCEGGLMIDLSPMRAVTVDPEARIARVEAGATLGDVDRATQPHGLATPVGINSTTGIAGLTLGGGFGWLSRRHGMTVDNLVGADVVTADGALVHASEAQHPDLFWALRGGGGNFGVVTAFDFRLHEVGPDVLCGLLVYPADEGAEVLRRYRDFAPTLGGDTSVWIVLRKAPPLPFLAPEIHGQDVAVLAVLHVGDPEAGRRALEPLRTFGTLHGEHLGVQPFVAWQQAFDPMLTPGARNYWKSHNLTDLPDGLIEVLLSAAARMPSPQCEVFVGQLGRAASAVPADATAYAHRDAAYVLNVHGRWDEPADDGVVVEWARALFRDAAPFATGGVYVNFLTGEETDRIRAAYGANYARLVAIKRAYDPDNLFCMNQNIAPR